MTLSTDLPISFLKNESTPVSALLAVVIKKYGPECLEWESEILRDQVEKDFSIELSLLQYDKICAGVAVMTTTQAENNWPYFQTICHLFNNVADGVSVYTPLEAEEIAAALPEFLILKQVYNSLDSVEDNCSLHDGLFGDSVNYYCGAVFREYGFSKPPTIFPSAIITDTVDCDDADKNEALLQMATVRYEIVSDWLERAGKMHSE